MANQEHLDILKLGVDIWNTWRQEQHDLRPDLSTANLSGIYLDGANLMEADLNGADLSRVNLNGANLGGAYLGAANLQWAGLSRAYLCGAHLILADLSGADLSGADLSGADLTSADLRRADLSGANLRRANLVETNLKRAVLTDCLIYGISVWDVQLEKATQLNLVITLPNQPKITVDNLEVAQFIYLLLNNERIRHFINTITSKVVLILGRFTSERKAILEAIRDELRTQDYLPVLFDFEKPSGRNLTETVRTLAHLARFIIADLTDPSSIPQELQAIIPTLAVPVQAILMEGKREHAMFVDFLKTYHWVLPVYLYRDQASLLATLKESVIEPAEQKAQELEKRLL